MTHVVRIDGELTPFNQEVSMYVSPELAKKDSAPVEGVLSHVVEQCEQACSCCFEDGQTHSQAPWNSRVKRTAAVYATMVFVSTCTIYFLEHASVLSAFRTALVAAVGKTVAVNWVTSLFD